MAPRTVCACGRDAVDVMRVASDDGLLLVPLCAECADDPTVGEQREVFGRYDRRPLTAMPGRANEPQPFLPLDDVDEEYGAA